MKPKVSSEMGDQNYRHFLYKNLQKSGNVGCRPQCQSFANGAVDFNRSV